MPKFFYTVLVFSLLLWAAFLFVGSGFTPASAATIFVFSLGILIALGLSLTLVVFAYLNAKSSATFNKRLLFRRALKYGYFISFFMVGMLTIRALKVNNLINYILFFGLCALLYNQLKTTRREQI